MSMNYALELNKEYNKALQYLMVAKKMTDKLRNKRIDAMLSNQFTPIEKLSSLKSTEKNFAYYIKALDIMKKIFGQDHIRIARYYHLLGQVYKNSGDLVKAKQCYQKALDIIIKQQFSDKILSTKNQKDIEIIQKHLQTLI